MSASVLCLYDLSPGAFFCPLCSCLSHATPTLMLSLIRTRCGAGTVNFPMNPRTHGAYFLFPLLVRTLASTGTTQKRRRTPRPVHLPDITCVQASAACGTRMLGSKKR